MRSPPKARSAALELEELEAAEPVAVPVPEPDAPELVAAEDVDVAEEDCVAGVVPFGFTSNEAEDAKI